MEALMQDRRKALNKTQYEIASFVGVTQGMVAKVEDGIRTPKRKLRKWAAAYRCSVKQFKKFLAAAKWTLPLWSFFVDTPLEVESIRCVPMTPERAQELLHRKRPGTALQVAVAAMRRRA